MNYRTVSQITSPALDVVQNILMMPIKSPLFNRSQDAPPASQEAQQLVPVPRGGQQPGGEPWVTALPQPAEKLLK